MMTNEPDEFEPLDDFLLGKISMVLQLHGYGYPSELIRAALKGRTQWQNREGRWLEITGPMHDNCIYAAKQAGVL